MSLNNLSYIGHLGNIMTSKDHDAESSSNNEIIKKSLYNNSFGFEGTGDLFAGMGLLAGNREIRDITGSITAVMEGSHNVKMLSFGLDTIFQVGQTGFLPNLESLGFMKYLDISSMMSGIKLPPPVALTLGKDRAKG